MFAKIVNAKKSSGSDNYKMKHFCSKLIKDYFKLIY